ncbi:MAG: ATP-binding cassette domain-containing protein [Drouetiella hepatica Uher 2000/2452]|jgi:lipopolysaccharide transport system ATP-binding protein|uniref:ATP-binding cassette domain-containing protein n=1 Tax=Drouetiella hepatica Uher 2000/2452 TaxID=904376 RepID=A0A951UNP4_9CYAN|nr:ATP-binding cassette domain-containing protein [Drouetiella hepatica Uher 2000/2452]
MSDTVIRVENLSKKYVLSHQREGQQYKALRDVIAEGAKSLGQRLMKPMGKPELSPTQEEFWALKDVSFEIKQGDRVGIIGRNGAGKSTLLKVLSRIVEPTSGRISIKGRVASLLEVGTGFHPELTGRENIYLNGAILGMSREEIKRKFDEIVAFAEVEKFLDTPVKRYSSGMYVRLAFSVAAHLEPEVLIVDEVLAVGDIQFQKKCLGKMEQVAGEGRTIIFVSHEMGTISALCNQVVFLKKGQVHSIGETERIVTEYFSEVLKNKNQELGDLRLPGFGKKIRFSNIELLSRDNNIRFGELITYKLEISSDHNFQGLSIGSSFFKNDGICIGSLISDEFDICANKQLNLRLTVSNMNLAPGSYYAGFSIGFGQKEGVRKDLEIVVGKPSFQILPLLEDSTNISSWNSSWGNIFFKDNSLVIVSGSSNESYKMLT